MRETSCNSKTLFGGNPRPYMNDAPSGDCSAAASFAATTGLTSCPHYPNSRSYCHCSSKSQKSRSLCLVELEGTSMHTKSNPSKPDYRFLHKCRPPKKNAEFHSFGPNQFASLCENYETTCPQYLVSNCSNSETDIVITNINYNSTRRSDPLSSQA